MVEEKESSGAGRPGRRRVRRWLALGCLLPVALLAGAIVFRGAWLGPLSIRYLRERARAELGAELTIERISGGWLRDLTLEGVSWECARPPLLGLREARVELGYSLSGAWRGEPELAVRLWASGIELAIPRQEGRSGTASGTLPDLARIELDLADVVVRQVGREPQRVESLRARGGLRDGRAMVEELELVAGANRLTLRDASLDLSRPEWIDLARSTRGELVASLPDARFLEELVGRSFGLCSAELTLAAENGRARLAGTAKLENGQLRVERGELVLPENGDLEALQVDLGLSAEFSDLAPVGELLGQPLEGRWRGSIDVKGPLRAPVGRFVGRGEALRIAGLALDLAEIDVETDGTGEVARLERCEISGPGLEAVLRGKLRLRPLELVDVALNVSADAAPFEALLPRVPCEGAFLHANLSGPVRSPSGTFECSVSGVELYGFRIDDAEARGKLGLDTLEVAELRLTSGESFVEAAGTLRRAGMDFTADLERLGVAWLGARAELERGAHLEFGARRFAVEGLELASEGAGEPGRARVALRHERGVTRARLDFERYDAGPLLSPILPEGWKAGRASGHVEGELGGELDTAGAPSALELDLALEGWSASSAWPELDGRLRGSFDGRALDLEDFELGLAAGEAPHARGALRVPLDLRSPLALGPGPVALRLELETQDAVASLRRAGLAPGLSASGPARLELDLAGEWDALRGNLALDARAITLGDEAGSRVCDLEAELAFGERVRVERARFSGPVGSVTLSGAVGATLDVPRWTADPLVLLDAPLDLEARLDLADIGWVAGLSEDLRRVSGQVAGRVEIRGTAFEPELGGALVLREGEVRVASPRVPSLQHVAASVSLAGDVVRIESLTGEVGGAPVRVSGTVEPLGPFRRLDLELAGENLLVVRDARFVLRADAKLEVKGTPSQLSIRGELGLAEGRYTTEISPLEEVVQAGKRGDREPAPTHFSLFPEGPLANSELNVHIGGTRAFEYRTNLLSASLRPDAWLRGTGEFPVLEGPVLVEEASLILPSGTLELVSGVLTFRREAPLVPEVALTAGMRVQRRDVTATIAGSVAAPEVVLSSSPPMATDDLWLLVLTGQLPAARGEEKDSQAMEALAVFLARDTLVRWFGSEPGDAENLLERFEIEVGAKPSESGQPTGRVVFYLRQRDRKSGRATYLSAESDVHDRVNFALGIVFRPR